MRARTTTAAAVDDSGGGGLGRHRLVGVFVFVVSGASAHAVGG